MVFTLRNWSYSVLPAVTYLQKQNKQTNLNKKNNEVFGVKVFILVWDLLKRTNYFDLDYIYH